MQIVIRQLRLWEGGISILGVRWNSAVAELHRVGREARDSALF